MELPLICFLKEKSDKLDELGVDDRGSFLVLLGRILSVVKGTPLEPQVKALVIHTVDDESCADPDFFYETSQTSIICDIVSRLIYCDELLSSIDTLDKWQDFFSGVNLSKPREIIRRNLLELYALACPGMFGKSGLTEIFGSVLKDLSQEVNESDAYSDHEDDESTA